MISKYRQTNWEKPGCASYFQPACLNLKITSRTFTCILHITYYTPTQYVNSLTDVYLHVAEHIPRKMNFSEKSHKNTIPTHS